jgi:prefoldin subunit 5
MAKSKPIKVEAKIRLEGPNLTRITSAAVSPFSLYAYLILKGKATWGDLERVFVKNPKIHITKQTLNNYLKKGLIYNNILKITDEKTGKTYYTVNPRIEDRFFDEYGKFIKEITLAFAMLMHEYSQLYAMMQIKKLKDDLENEASYVDHVLSFGEINIKALKSSIDFCDKSFNEFKQQIAKLATVKKSESIWLLEMMPNEIISKFVETAERAILMLMRAVNYLKAKGKIPPEEISPLENRVLKLDAEIQKMKREIEEQTKSEKT